MPKPTLVKMVTLVAVAAAVVLLAGSIGLGARDLDEKRSATDVALTNKVDDASAQLGEYFARARSIVLITANNPAFRDFAAAPGDRVAKIRARVPAIIEWPAVIKQPRITRHSAGTFDIFPTLADLLSLPASVLLNPVDGTSLRPRLTAVQKVSLLLKDAAA